MSEKSFTASGLCRALGLTAICEPDGEKTVTGGYCGDLLSWVMGRAAGGCAWITVMTNANVIGVATLADVGCVIFADGAEPDHDAVIKASARGVNLYKSPLPSYELCAAVANALAGRK